MSFYLAGAKLDISGIIQDWAMSATFKRFSGATTASGRRSGTFVAFGSGTVVIRPIGGQSNRVPAGLLEKTTHVMFARVTVSLSAEDRVAVSGETYEYDVLVSEDFKSHKQFQLARVERS